MSPSRIASVVPLAQSIANRLRLPATLVVLALSAGVDPAWALQENVNAGSTGDWILGSNWGDGTAPATGGVLTNTRINVNGLIEYNFPGVTTTFDVAAVGNEARPFGIASGSNTSGTLLVTAGTLIFTTESGLGRDFGPFITAALDSANNSTGLLRINGGNVIINGATSYLNVMARGGATSTGTLTIDSGSLTVDRIDFGALAVVAGSTGTVNLNGGTLNVKSISSGVANMIVNLNLNGGTIATSGAALAGLDLIGANIDSANLGGVVNFDTTLGDAKISAVLNGAGGITKIGSGTLTISSPAGYTGATTINAGTLATTTAQNGTGSVTLGDGATFALSRATAGGTLNLGSLTLGASTGGTLSLNSGAFALSTANAFINATSFSTNGMTQIQLSGGSIGSGIFPLIDYSGSIGGAGFAGLSANVTGAPRLSSATLINNTTDGRVDVSIVNQAIQWVGGVSADWDVDDSSTGAIEGTQNWKTEISNTATNYLQGTGGTDIVIFDDTATGSRNINLTMNVTPAGITVNNTTLSGDYLFGGVGSIGGNGALVKNGTGTLVLANFGGNTYSGGTTINAGTLQVMDGISPLGSGPVTIQGGTLDIVRPGILTIAAPLTGTAGTLSLSSTGTTLALTGTGTNFSGMVNIGPGAILAVNNTATLGGTITGDGDLQINPIGGKIVTLGGTSNFNGAVTVTTNSHLRLTNGTALGSTISGTTINGSGSDLDSDVSGGSLQLSGNITVDAEPLTLRGTGGFAAGAPAQQRGALQSLSGNNTWNGPITIAGTNTRIGVQDGASLTLGGTISDGGAGFAIIFRGGTTTAGVITISGAGNQWGDTRIYGSRTQIGRDNALPVGGVLYVGTNGVGASTFDLNGHQQQAAGLTQAAGTLGVVTNGGAVDAIFTINGAGSFIYDGTLTDGGTNRLSLVKLGTCTQTLTGTNSYTGTTTIGGGTLVVNGMLTGSAVTVNGGTLSGNNGTVNTLHVAAGGKLAPGPVGVLGLLNSSALTMDAGSTFALDINTATMAHDTQNVFGDLTLDLTTAPSLTVTDLGGNMALSMGTPFLFLTYSGLWNHGLFQVGGVPIVDGIGTFTVGQNQFTIDYDYNGNNVALVVVPEPTAATLLLGGLALLTRRRRKEQERLRA